MRTILCFAAGLTALGLASSAAMAQARGSYLRTCVDVRQNGPFLAAACRDRFGGYRDSRIDVRGCRGDISNANGRLVCGGGGYGEPRYEERRRPRYEDGYDEPPPRRRRYEERW